MTDKVKNKIPSREEEPKKEVKVKDVTKEVLVGKDKLKKLYKEQSPEKAAYKEKRGWLELKNLSKQYDYEVFT